IVANLPKLPKDSLFPPLDSDYSKYDGMLKSIETLDSSCFYGRPLGFQFSPSVGRVFHFIGVILATYSLSWEKGHGPFGSLLNSGRFLLSPEQRAKRIIKVTREADITFCKGFWNLAEVGQQVPHWFLPTMALNEVIDIPWVGPIGLATADGGRVEIPEPSAHTGLRPVRIRIISYKLRDGLNIKPSWVPSTPRLPLSPYLLFHCHGGGYVATSSKSHETYLRTWAKLLNCTVLSVDYSLAPENPFPRPTEEVLFAYAWALNNATQLGWTGEKICCVGDSAGGNLLMSLNIRLIDLNVARKPDGLVLVYTPFLFQYLPSPSRLLSFMDPLLHMGVVLRCVAAYTGAYQRLEAVRLEAERMARSGGSMENNSHKSLQEYFDEVQKAQEKHKHDLNGPQPIVSLVNLQSDHHSPTAMEQTEQEHPTATFTLIEQNGQQQELEVDEDGALLEPSPPEIVGGGQTPNDPDKADDSAPLTTVEIHRDPTRIWLTSSIYDHEFVDYLSQHPLTRESLVLCDVDMPAAARTNLAEESVGAVAIGGNSALLAEQQKENNVFGSPKSPLRKTNCVGALNGQYEQQLRKPDPEPTTPRARTLSQTVAETAALAAGHAFDNLSDWLDYQPPLGAADKQKLDRAASLTPQQAAEMEQVVALECEADSELTKLRRMRVPKNPLISPMYASDEQLRALPPVWFVACHLDPLLDDAITFARKLRAAGGKVMAMDLLDSLPHGFLNFTLMSPECREGAKLCLGRIREALGMPDAERH
uniref:Hormone-sensitive lipase n=1 Tax=Plectus sambesii TaxID=2011161 RepID=A0A914XCR2_9BILA